MFSPFSILPVALSRHVAYCNCNASIVRYPRYLSKVAIFIYINFFLTHFQNFQWFILVWLQTSLPDTSGTSSPCLNDYFIVLLHCICVNNNNLLMELDLKKTSPFHFKNFPVFFITWHFEDMLSLLEKLAEFHELEFIWKEEQSEKFLGVQNSPM